MNPKAGPELEVIVAKVEGLSRFRNLHAKLTFLATGSESGYPCEDMHKPCLRILKAFGSERCIWGSDFPCELWTPRVSYRDNLRLFTEALSLSERDRANILGMTARRLFFPKLNEGGD
jgi:predicted TIM-barrel fold metal-dependent hydrolase